MEVESGVLPLHRAVQVKGVAQPVVGGASGGGEGEGPEGEGQEGEGKKDMMERTRSYFPSTQPRPSNVCH